nr:hypothetical protein [Tanacetum cinerariifolium]
MKSVIKCTTAKAIWTDLILAHEGPSDTRDTRILKWLSMYQTHRADNLRMKRWKGKRKKIISLKEVVFTKADESPSETAPEITSDPKFECDVQEMPHLPKLSRAEPIGTSADVITLDDLTQTLAVSKEIKRSLIKEVKGLKEKIKTPLDNSVSVSQTRSSKFVKGKKRLSFDLVNIVVGVKKTMAKLKAQSSHGSSSRKVPMILKPYVNCKYYGFNDHHSSECKHYPGCDIYGRIAHETANYAKKPSSNNKKPRISNRRSTEPTEKWVNKRN